MLYNSPSQFNDYQLIDSGNFEKLERFGKIITRRPEPQAVWNPSLSEDEWVKRCNAYFKKEKGSAEKGEWILAKNIPAQWQIKYQKPGMDLTFRLGFSSFKHVGIFPEQAANWDYIYKQCSKLKKPKVLNLFAYTGGATLAAAAGGADVTHLDSVKQVLNWANDNVQLSGFDNVRWMLDDAFKFVQREVRRGVKYQGIILDPPSYGRGPNGEKWVLEEKINELAELCGKLLDTNQSFIVFNLYSMGLSPLIIENLQKQHISFMSEVSFGELYVEDDSQKKLPLGTFLRGSVGI
ncbi:MAG: hypothetical protein RLZZ175_1669 [Bacteroidota bacterium]|jgi:23S rRNA (cytosine1962-C5)-methyltransferase